jgi:hypothetical protein
MAGAELAIHLVGQRLDGSRVGHVGDHADDVTALRQLSDRGCQYPGLDVGDRHPAALVEQGTNDPPSDACGTAGHHSHLARQIVHVTPPGDSPGAGPGPCPLMVAHRHGVRSVVRPQIDGRVDMLQEPGRPARWTRMLWNQAIRCRRPPTSDLVRSADG